MRVDPLVKETHIHYPTDSGLLGDGVRVLTLTMSRIVEIAGQTGVFFSSRRRHTRLVSDWSSDVCSSDLFLTALLAVAILDPVHPPEPLPPVAPISLQMILALELLEPAELLPHRGERIILQHGHKLPVVVAAQLQDRTICIQPVQQHQNWQPRKILFHALGQSVEGVELTVLLAPLLISFSVIQEFA